MKSARAGSQVQPFSAMQVGEQSRRELHGRLALCCGGHTVRLAMEHAVAGIDPRQASPLPPPGVEDHPGRLPMWIPIKSIEDEPGWHRADRLSVGMPF